MAGWCSFENLLEAEFAQSREEGRDPALLAPLEREASAAKGDPDRLAALHDEVLRVPIRGDFPYHEPSALDEIQAARRDPSGLSAALPDDLDDRLLGAWLGRCVGCVLGKPAECFMYPHNGLLSWQRQKRYLTAISPDEWPVRDYFPAASPAESETGPLNWGLASMRETLAFVETDDDIRYTVLGQILLRERGVDFGTADVASAWIRHLPYGSVCSAETQAYRNLALRGTIRLSGVLWDEGAAEWIATHHNPFREWIGAQIRVDSYGYAVPGRPAQAAEMAWRDARLSHVKNGLYGAMFCAAMISAAFVLSDVREIIAVGLGEIPCGSRLHADLLAVRTLCERAADFEEVLEGIVARLGFYSPVHTINNAALCLAALWFSEGDFARGVTLAVSGGWDTDCNGATVGSIVGAMTGARRVPPFWTGRLNDTLMSDLPGYHPIAISECARRSGEIARRAAGSLIA